MKKTSLITLGLCVVMGVAAKAEPLNLGSSSSRIKTKSQAIEAEYSQSMRKRQQQRVDPDNMPHMGALTIDEAPVQREVSNVVESEESFSQPMVVAPAASGELREIPGAQNSYWSEMEGPSYTSNLKLRDEKKVGAGISAGGQLGVAAFNMEFNFEDADGVIAGFGAGPGYNTIGLGWKHSFEGKFLNPYTSLTYSRWYNSRGVSSEFKHSSILDMVLTDKEKSEGKFATDFANVSAGLQYNQLRGDLAGLSVFAELTAMYEINRDMLIPNGGIGALYFF